MKAKEAADYSAITELRALYGMMSPRRRRHLVLMFVVMLVVAVAELVTIGLAVPFLSVVLAPGRSGPAPSPWGLPFPAAGGSSLVTAALLFAGAGVVAALARLLLAGISQSFAFRLGHELGTTMFSRMLRQPYGYYIARNTTELLIGMEKVQVVVYSVLLPAIQGVSATVLAVCITILLFLIHPYAAALGGVVMAGVYISISLATRSRLRSNSAVLTQSATARMKLVREGLGGIRDILLDQSQEVFEDTFREFDARYRRAQAANSLINSAPRHIVESAALILVAFVAVGVSFRQGGVVNALPLLGAFALGSQRLIPLLQQVYAGWSQCLGNIHALRDTLNLLRAPVVVSIPRSTTQPPLPFTREIVIDNVSFRYGDGAYAVSGASLRIPRGARVGVVGRSGGGKSTLLDLLMGLLEPTSGEIRVDGQLLDAATRPHWQRQIAHVPQAIYLADRSIAANIAFGEAEDRIDMERMEAAARQAEIHDFIMGLPEGFGTRVGERGVQLSGGQRQRVGIARALYKRASLLIFDEVTSALDEATEAAVMKSIAAIESGRTVVIVTHRISNLDSCDFIVRMDGGRLVAPAPVG
ncbi:MAG TPA: ABC transporter ATP-binding protein [Longimicrobium sp.]